MTISIHSPGMETTEPLAQHVNARLEAALGQWESRIDHVEVHLADVNAGRGGVDKACTVAVRMKPRGDVRVEEVEEDLYSAISHAADRVKVAVGRNLEKSRRH